MIEARRTTRALPKAYLFLVAALTFVPLAALVMQSLAFRWNWPDLLPSQWWLDRRDSSRFPIGWDYVFSPHSRLAEATANTILIASGATALCLALCWPAAHALSAPDFRGKLLAELMFSSPLFVPETAIAVAFLALSMQLGLGGSVVGVILAHTVAQVPYVLRILVATFQRHGRDSEEQAAILGAPRRQIFFEITLPLVAPGVAAACLFAFLVSSSVFTLTFFLGQGQVITLPTILIAKLSGGTLDASSAGLALLSLLPGAIALILVGHHLTPSPPG
ncbi:MAG: ABC transporter permease subunit [Devosia sp.]|nr:ABC transporter permease subunit [Devosia sp.]